jgi:hypothetical protein
LLQLHCHCHCISPHLKSKSQKTKEQNEGKGKEKKRKAKAKRRGYLLFLVLAGWKVTVAVDVTGEMTVLLDEAQSSWLVRSANTSTRTSTSAS